MKKLALVLAIAFTMGLAASSVSAATKDKAPKKATTEQKTGDKKDCPAEAKAACGEKKACCADKKK